MPLSASLDVLAVLDLLAGLSVLAVLTILPNSRSPDQEMLYNYLVSWFVSCNGEKSSDVTLAFEDAD